MPTTTAPTLSPVSRIPAGTVLALLCCYLVWGSTYLAIRLALESFPPFFQMGSRFLLAGALLALFMAWRGRRAGVAALLPSARQWRNAFTWAASCSGPGWASSPRQPARGVRG